MNDVKVADFFARKCNLVDIHKLETQPTAKNTDFRQKKTIEKKLKTTCNLCVLSQNLVMLIIWLSITNVKIPC